MELTRRDALVALAASGATVGAGAVAFAGDDSESNASANSTAGTGVGADPSESRDGFDDYERETLVAIADVVYPSEVEGIPDFVRSYLDGRTIQNLAYVSAATEAVGTLDDLSTEWHGDRFLALDQPTREQVLREVGAETAEPDPDGSPAERVRYYLVNELLFALYASPTGGELVGIENPQGHPGGQASYQRGPNR